MVIVVALSAGIAVFLARREKVLGWKTVLLALFCLAGGVLGNLLLGYINGLSVKYLFFDVLGVTAGTLLAYLLFRRLF